MKKVLSLAMASLFITGVTFANLDGGKGCCAKKGTEAKCEKKSVSLNEKEGKGETIALQSTVTTPGASKEACKGTKTDCASKEAKGACCSKSSAKASTKEIKAEKEVSIR